MSWLKTDDRIASHPKILMAGPEAAWLWLAATAYAKNHLTDGFVPDAALPTLAQWSVPVEELTRRCVEARVKPGGHGLLEPAPGGFLVHDYLDHNPSRDHVKAEMQKAAKRKADLRARVAADHQQRSARRRKAASEAPDCPADVPTGHPVPDRDLVAVQGRTCHDHGQRAYAIGAVIPTSTLPLIAFGDQVVSVDARVGSSPIATGDADVPLMSSRCPSETGTSAGTYSDADSPQDQNPDQEHRAAARPSFSTACGKPPEPRPEPKHSQLCALVKAERRDHPNLDGVDLLEHVKCRAARLGLPYDSRSVWSAIDAVATAAARKVS